MSKPWIDIKSLSKDIRDFFIKNKSDISNFGATVNQCFEAFVFTSVVNWYDKRGWSIELKHPNNYGGYAQLKFSTRGKPSAYTYVICKKDKERIQIRHNLRVATKNHILNQKHPANVVLDVAIISDIDLSGYNTDDHVDNSHLVTFGEAKHMSAFAELVANFIGLVHEMMPRKLRKIRVNRGDANKKNLSPFLYVSGFLKEMPLK